MDKEIKTKISFILGSIVGCLSCILLFYTFTDITPRYGNIIAAVSVGVITSIVVYEAIYSIIDYIESNRYD